MDVSSTLIGLGLLVVFIGPVIFLIYTQNKKNAVAKKLLHQKSQEYGIQPELTELAPNFILGLDSSQSKLLVLVPKNAQSVLINLSELALCEVRITDIKDLPGKVNHIGLVLGYKKKGVQALEIVFYDE